MTKKEFERFCAHHCALFPGLLIFIARAYSENAELIKAFWDEWYAVLERESLEDAKYASRKLAESGSEHHYERHPWILREIIASRKLEKTKTVTDVRCELCADTGFVVVERDGRRAALACSCDRGKRAKTLWPSIAVVQQQNAAS